MGKTIIITEKPSVAQEYKKVLKVSAAGKTDGYIEGESFVLKKDLIITWAVGHLVSLGCVEEQLSGHVMTQKAITENKTKWNGKELPILPSKWVYTTLPATKKQFEVIKKLYTRKDIDCIYYAGDSGREGIYIQALIRNQIFSKDPAFEEKVVWIDSYTEESIINGIKNAKPYSTYQNMIDSGYCRAILDWLIGMNFTRGLTVASKNLVKVGRVKTPTLAMVVKRQDEIDNFKTSYFYGLNAETEYKTSSWKADKTSKYFESPLLFNETGFKSKDEAEKLLAEFKNSGYLKCIECTTTEKKEYAPLLFNLADLQAYCSRVFKISPAKTLEIAQELYEAKYTTYPRTDARYLSSAVAKEIKAKFGKSVPPKYVNDDKITDHYAIIPTFAKGCGRISDLADKVYKAIVERYENIFKPPYVYDSSAVIWEVSDSKGNGKKEHFYQTINKVKQNGWKMSLASHGEGCGSATSAGCCKNTEVNEDFVLSEKTPKKNEVVKADFLAVEKQTNPPKPYTTGTLILAMERAGNLLDDKELQDTLKGCGIGTSATRAAIISDLEKSNYINIEGKSQKISPTSAGKDIVSIAESIDKELISPAKTAEMEQSLADIAAGKIKRNNFEKETDKYIIDTVKRILSNNYTVSSGAKNSKGSSDKYTCPCCGKPLKYGKYGYYCECKFSINNEICGAKIAESDVEKIINKGKSGKKKFKSKTGKTFEAYLVLNKDEKKLKFEFAPKKNYSSNKYSKKSKEANGKNIKWL